MHLSSSSTHCPLSISGLYLHSNLQEYMWRKGENRTKHILTIRELLYNCLVAMCKYFHYAYSLMENTSLGIKPSTSKVLAWLTKAPWVQSEGEIFPYNNIITKKKVCACCWRAHSKWSKSLFGSYFAKVYCKGSSDARRDGYHGFITRSASVL